MPLWDALSNVMRGSRRRRIRTDEAEQLLGPGHDPEHPELSRLLAAATAPPRPHELTGLPEALAAFEDAGRLERPAPARRRRRLLRPLAAAVATSVVLVGGVAMATEVGYLPGGDRRPADEHIQPHDVSTSTASHGTTSRPARTSHPTPTPTHGNQTKDPEERQIERLCRKWDKGHEKGRAMKPGDLRELAQTAGGEERIPKLCAPLLRPPGPPTAPRSTTHPTHAASPSATHQTHAASPNHPDNRQHRGGPARTARPPAIDNG